MIVGHQPTLGNLACYLLTGADASWSVRKGAVWWFRGRQREQKLEAVLRLVIAPEWLL